MKATSLQVVIGKHEKRGDGMIALTYLESSPRRLQIVLKMRYDDVFEVFMFF